MTDPLEHIRQEILRQLEDDTEAEFENLIAPSVPPRTWPRTLMHWLIALCFLAGGLLIGPGVAKSAPGGGIWRAGISIFMTSDDAPISMMLGQFPKPFTSKDACKTFIKGIEKDVQKDIDELSDAPSEAAVVNHQLFCTLDETGEGV